MITLATLPEATPQQVFDQVVTHLREQGEKALNDGGDCEYHADSGTKCAAGCLISDNEYDADFERTCWYDLVNESKVPTAHGDLIHCLQDLHDNHHPDDWEEGFERLAGEHGLAYTPKEDV